MAEWLRANTLAEDYSLVPSTHGKQLTATLSPVPKELCPLLAFVGTCIHVHKSTYIHIMNNKSFKNIRWKEIRHST